MISIPFAHRLLTGAAIACLALGCQKSKSKKTSTTPSDDATQTSTAPASTQGLFQPPVARYPRPLQLRRDLETRQPVGELSMPGADGKSLTRDLLAATYALCRDGWVFQGIYKGDKGLAVTDPVVVLEPRPKDGSPQTYVNPHNANLETRYTFKVPPRERMRGELTMKEKDAGLVRLSAKFDGDSAVPVPARGLGTLGCFTTGHYTIKGKDALEVMGPVTSKLDYHDAYKIHAELSQDHAITIWLHLPPADFRVGQVFDEELSEVLAKPKDFAARAFLDTRKSKDGLLEWEQKPIEQGRLTVELEGADSRDAVAKVKITGLAIPSSWGGPGAGESHDLVLRTRFVTDRAGLLIPIAPKL
jgi:hypothetical protein